ncbi:MAG: TonB-dependent receptor plug domain-containing protein, partial [Vicinamibacterales bacterium]|nr:TonB-dependent receptor plug domain-containing protein [Vicinamibacterales bacterium]
MKQTVGLLVLALGVLVVTPALARQAVAVTGTVTDSSGAVLPGATIEALRGARVTSTTTTGSDGRYRLELPATGNYRLEVQLDGFATGVATVPAGTGATQDFQLGLAPVNDTVVVTASRTAESRASVTESLSVFTADDIQALGSHSLADIVTTIPGLNIETTGREGSGSSLFSRGGEGDYNHVIIDGVRVNTSGGGFNFSRVSASEIERVEVVRGAQSALYGSDAIGSVVQIFTKRGSPTAAPRVYGSFESGTFNTVRSDLRLLGGAQQRFDYQFGAAYRGTDGAFEDRLPDPDRFDQTSYDASF